MKSAILASAISFKELSASQYAGALPPCHSGKLTQIVQGDSSMISARSDCKY